MNPIIENALANLLEELTILVQLLIKAAKKELGE